MTSFSLYVRKDCAHCEQLQFALELLKQRTALDYTVVDVDDDAQLVAQFGTRVPVLVLGQQTVLEGVFDIATLDSDIASALERDAQP